MVSGSFRHYLVLGHSVNKISFRGISIRKHLYLDTGFTMSVPNIAPLAIPYHVDSELVLDANLELAAEEQNPELRPSDGQLLISSYIWSTSSSSS
jgi:hypothetical protein